MGLTAEEWIRINEAIKLIYNEGSERQVRRNILDAIYSLVPFDFGDFCYTTKDELSAPITDPVVKTKFSRAFQQEYEHAYQNYYSQMDYTKWCLSNKESIVFRESDIFDDAVRANNKYFTDFLKPRNMIYSIICYIVIPNKKALPGAITMYRGNEQGDFSEHELELLHTLLPHMEKSMSIFAAGTQEASGEIDYVDLYLINNYQLTRRETAVVRELMNGCSNGEIADRLNISVYTVKKHISNILSKTNTTSRIKLLQLISGIEK